MELDLPQQTILGCPELGVLTLPTEIIMMILKKLEWNDLIIIRLVCRLFAIYVPIETVLYDKFKLDVFIMEHILLYNQRDCFEYMKYVISADNMKNYKRLVFDVKRHKAHNAPSIYSPDIIRDMCFHYFKTHGELCNIFTNNSDMRLYLCCIYKNRIDILEDIFRYYDIRKKVKLQRTLLEQVVIQLIIDNMYNMLMWVISNFIIGGIYYEDVIEYALYTNDIRYMKIIENNFRLGSYEELAYNLTVIENNETDAIDKIIRSNCTIALEYILGRLDIIYNKRADLMYYRDGGLFDYQRYYGSAVKYGHKKIMRIFKNMKK